MKKVVKLHPPTKVGGFRLGDYKENYPHKCPYCGEPAWNGGLFECSSWRCITNQE